MKTVIMLLLSLASSACCASECLFHILDDDAVRRTEHVFVFRLLSAAIDQHAEKNEILYQATGKIEVLESLRGNGKQFQNVRFTTFSLCGTRLDVGHMFLAFISGSGHAFDVSAENLFHIGSASDDSLLAQARKVVTGKIKFTDFARTFASDRIREIPPPPTPCVAAFSAPHGA